MCECKAEELQRRRLAKMFAGSELWERFKDFDLDTFAALPDTDRYGKDFALSMAQQMAETGVVEKDGVTRPGLMLWGDLGTGKTGLMVSILYALGQRGLSVLAVSFTELESMIKDSYDDESNLRTEEVFAMLNSVDVLGIDDLGATRLTRHATDLLYRIVASRHVTNKGLICTTNYSPALLAQALMNPDTQVSPTADRIDQLCHAIKVGGVNLRKGSAL